MEGLRLLLTGASRGLGRALAVRFAERGVRLVLTARTEGGLSEVSDEIVSRGFAPPVLVVLDLREGDREASADGSRTGALGVAIAERLGGLEGVILNAALLGDLSPVAHSEDAMWREVFDVNVFANRRLLSSVHSLLRASRGFVVGVSCGEKCGEAYWGCYGASKAAMGVMLESYGKESERQGIRVESWDPGRMSTGLRSAAYPGEGREYPITDETTGSVLEIVERWVEKKRG